MGSPIRAYTPAGSNHHSRVSVVSVLQIRNHWLLAIIISHHINRNSSASQNP